MRQLAALVAVFAIISNYAWAFDHSPEAVGQIYFSIPFGAAPNQDATPHLGFRVAYGDGLTFPDRDEPGTYRDLSFRLNLDRQTDLLVNGVDVAEFYPTLSVAEDEGRGKRWPYWTALGIVAGVALTVVIVSSTYSFSGGSDGGRD
jgi:hypothetical protein